MAMGQHCHVDSGTRFESRSRRPVQRETRTFWQRRNAEKRGRVLPIAAMIHSFLSEATAWPVTAELWIHVFTKQVQHVPLAELRPLQSPTHHLPRHQPRSSEPVLHAALWQRGRPDH